MKVLLPLWKTLYVVIEEVHIPMNVNTFILRQQIKGLCKKSVAYPRRTDSKTIFI